MDPFAAFFGQQQQQRGQDDNNENNKQRANIKRGDPYTLKFKVPLEKFYNGGEIQTSIKRRVICKYCGANFKKRNINKRKLTNDEKNYCSSCKSCPGEVRMVQRQVRPGMYIQQQERVKSKEKCKDEQALLTGLVEKGMDSGHKLTFERYGEQKPGEVPGDVILELQQKKHKYFSRDQDNLKTSTTISLKDALVGAKFEFKHLDEHSVNLEIDPIKKFDEKLIKDEEKKINYHKYTSIIEPNMVLNLKDEGMPKHGVPSEFGDLKIEFKVDFPKKLTKEQKDKLKEILP